MSKLQWMALGSCNMAVYASIGGLVGLMPLYLRQLGAEPSVSGLFLATIYGALAISNIAAGRLVARFPHHQPLLIAGGLLASGLAWLLSRVVSVRELLLLMTVLWFVIGIPMTMANVLTGLAAKATARGRSFGWLMMSSGVGLFLGGLVSGPLVDRGGFPTLFLVFSFVYLLIPLAGLAISRPRALSHPNEPAANFRGVFKNRSFLTLFAATILAQAANILIFLSRPLLMDALHFSATTISTVAAVGGIVTLPLPFLLGWITDRVGRKVLLLFCFCAPIVGLFVQSLATQPWHFIVSSMLATVIGASAVVGAALVTDLFAPVALSTALALFNATAWIGIVVGLSSGGLAMEQLQMRPALWLAAAVGVSALLLLLPLAESAPLLQKRSAPLRRS